jgi:hypothetical protein
MYLCVRRINVASFYDFSGIRVSPSFVLCVVFCRSLYFSFVHCVVCPSIYVFWLSRCLSFNLSLLIITLSVLQFTSSDYHVVCPSIYVFWLSRCLSFKLRLLITILVSSNFSYIRRFQIIVNCLFVVCLMVFNNISWRSVLLVEEIGGLGENHRTVASHWQTLSHNFEHLDLIEIRTYNISGDRHWLDM